MLPSHVQQTPVLPGQQGLLEKQKQAAGPGQVCTVGPDVWCSVVEDLGLQNTNHGKEGSHLERALMFCTIQEERTGFP